MVKPNIIHSNLLLGWERRSRAFGARCKNKSKTSPRRMFPIVKNQTSRRTSPWVARRVWSSTCQHIRPRWRYRQCNCKDSVNGKCGSTGICRWMFLGAIPWIKIFFRLRLYVITRRGKSSSNSYLEKLITLIAELQRWKKTCNFGVWFIPVMIRLVITNSSLGTKWRKYSFRLYWIWFLVSTLVLDGTMPVWNVLERCACILAKEIAEYIF